MDTTKVVSPIEGKDRQDLKDRRDRQDRLDPKDPRARWVLLVRRGLWVRAVRKETKVIRVRHRSTSSA